MQQGVPPAMGMEPQGLCTVFSAALRVWRSQQLQRLGTSMQQAGEGSFAPMEERAQFFHGYILRGQLWGYSRIQGSSHPASRIPDGKS